MTENLITTKEQACLYLEIPLYASEEMIKKAYREKVKLWHPDSGNSYANEKQFILIQQSYEFLLSLKKSEKEYHDANSIPVRPVKIFQTNANAKKQFTKQKQVEKDREFLRKWEEKKKRELREKEGQNRKTGRAYKDQYGLYHENKSNYSTQLTEEEALERIRAIWLAETIHRQMEADKVKKEQENKRKLYRAFMQQQMHDDAITDRDKNSK